MTVLSMIVQEGREGVSWRLSWGRAIVLDGFLIGAFRTMTVDGLFRKAMLGTKADRGGIVCEDAPESLSVLHEGLYKLGEEQNYVLLISTPQSR